MIENCAKCGSDKLIDNLKVIDRGHNSMEGNFSVAVDEKPEAFIFKQRMRSDVDAIICGECGYIEFYAKDPQTLYTAYLNRENTSE